MLYQKRFEKNCQKHGHLTLISRSNSKDAQLQEYDILFYQPNSIPQFTNGKRQDLERGKRITYSVHLPELIATK